MFHVWKKEAHSNVGLTLLIPKSNIWFSSEKRTHSHTCRGSWVFECSIISVTENVVCDLNYLHKHWKASTMMSRLEIVISLPLYCCLLQTNKHVIHTENVNKEWKLVVVVVIVFVVKEKRGGISITKITALTLQRIVNESYTAEWKIVYAFSGHQWIFPT